MNDKMKKENIWIVSLKELSSFMYAFLIFLGLFAIAFGIAHLMTTYSYFYGLLIILVLYFILAFSKWEEQHK